MTFFKNLPLLYCNLNLLRDSFGTNNQKILDLLLKVDVGMIKENKRKKKKKKEKENSINAEATYYFNFNFNFNFKF